MTPKPYDVYRPRQPTQREGIWRIDPIFAAGTIKPEVLKKWKLGSFPWWTAMLAIILAVTPIGWCGFKKKAKGTYVKSDRVSLSELQQLAEENVFVNQRGQRESTNPVIREVAEKNQTNAERMAAAIFLVEKTKIPLTNEVVARVVYSNKKTNTCFDDSPRFRLPTIAKIFWCIMQFAKPVFISLDFRHYFYQIPLPQCVRHFFSVLMGGKMWEHQVFPMGFTWSPFVGQSITMGALYETRNRWRRGQDTKQDMFEDVITFADLSGKPVAFAMAWYDNVLIIAESEAVREELAVILKAVLSEANIIVKGSKEEARRAGKNVSDMSDWDGWLRTEGEVEYIGIQFKSDNYEVLWRHAESNATEWLEKMQDWKNTTARHIASAVGILLWHLRVEGTPLAALVDELAVMSEVGRLMRKKTDWDEPLELDQKTIMFLQQRVSDIAKNRYGPLDDNRRAKARHRPSTTWPRTPATFEDLSFCSTKEVLNHSTCPTGVRQRWRKASTGGKQRRRLRLSSLPWPGTYRPVNP